MPDLPIAATSQILDFSTGDINKSYVVSGNINNELTAGRYDLIGGYLRMFASGADVSTAGQPASLSMYVFKDDIEIKEGGITPASAADVGAIYSNTYPEGGITYSIEDFDGEGDSLNYSPAAIQGYMGSDPFIWYDDAVDIHARKASVTRNRAKKDLKPYRTFDPRDQHLSMSDGSTSVTLNNNNNVIGGGQAAPDYSKSMGGLGRRGGGIARIYLTKEASQTYSSALSTDSSARTITWHPKVRKEDGSIKQSKHIQFSGEYNRTDRHQITDWIQYGSMHPLPEGDDSEARQTNNNTIFNEIFSSRLVHNPWNADATNPLVYSLLNLSKTEGQGFGNAARFYHSWDFASGSQGASGGKTAIEVEYGRSADVNGQTARASIYNIPIPLITDCGHDSDNSYAVSDRRTYFPEISMDMRIDKLGATPLYGVSTHTSKYTEGGDAMVYGLAAGATVNARAQAATIDPTDYTNDKCESLLRSVVITFSNYTPTDVSTSANITLDEFLNYGLNNFYIKQQTKHGIVGGLMFRTYGSIYNDTGAADAANTGQSYPSLDTNTIYAQALPVMPKNDLSGKSVGDGKLFENGGFIRLCTGKYDDGVFTDASCDLTTDSVSVTHTANTSIKAGQTVESTYLPSGTKIASITSSTAFKLTQPATATRVNETLTFRTDEKGGVSAAVTGDDYLLRLGVDSWIDAYQSQLGTDATELWAGPPLWQKLPFNSFFKLRLFWDVLACNSDASFSNIPYSKLNASSPTNEYASQGPICRAMFEVEGGGTDPELSSTEEYPFIDIPFPCNPLDDTQSVSQYVSKTKFWCPLDNETGELNATLDEDDAAKLFPKHMIIWVNNYRYIVGSANTRRETEILNGQDDDYYYYGDVSPDGSTQETELYIDNITIKDFTPKINNHTATNGRVSPWTIAPSSVESPLYNITGSGSGNENHRRLISFNAVSGTNAGGTNAASYRTLHPSNQVIMGWDDKSGNNANYMFFGDFSTLDFNGLNYFNYPFWTNFSNGGFISMADNVVTNDVNKLGHQFMGAHYISGAVEVQYGEMVGSYNNLSGASYEITDAGTVAGNKMTIASGSNSFMSTDAFTQKGFAYVSVSGSAGNDTAVDYGNWGKREHAGASVKITGVPRAGNGLADNQIQVADPSIFNEFSDDEYIIYRAHASDNNNHRLTGIKLAETGSIVGNTITFNKKVTTSTGGKPYMQRKFWNELYISPYKYWVTMTYPTNASYGASNNQLPASRSYSSIFKVDTTPTTAHTGTTFNENIYSYDTTATGTVGRSAMSHNVWDFEFDEEASVFELGQDWGYGPYDIDTSTGGEVDVKGVLSGNYVDFDLSGPIDTQTITDEQSFLLFCRMDGKMNNSGVDLYSPVSSDIYRTPRFYWQYIDLPPVIGNLDVKPAFDLLESDVNLYDLTTEDLNAVKFTWDEQEEDVWYRYMIVGTGSIANKYHGARLWMPLNEEPPNQNMKSFVTSHYVYDVVSGTSTTLANAAGIENQPLGIVAANGYESALTCDLTGISGWAPTFSPDTVGQYATLLSGGNFSFPFGSAAETQKFSVMAHCTPVSGTSQQWQFIFSKGVDANNGSPVRTGLSMQISGSSTPYVQVCHAGTFLTSSTPIPNDGSAVNIIYTYNSGSATGPDAKLYVDGVLEAYADTMPALPTTDTDLFIGTARNQASSAIWSYTSNGAADGSRTPDTYDGGGSGVTPTSTDGSGVIADTKFKIVVASDGTPTFTILSGASGYAVDDTLTFADAKMGGGGGASVVLTVKAIGMPFQGQTFNGHIEELVFYNHEIIGVPNSQEYIHNTANELDLSGTKLISHNAKVFVCDYHNIRGKSTKTQASTNEASWRATI
jgi:hypothetical protein